MTDTQIKELKELHAKWGIVSGVPTADMYQRVQALFTLMQNVAQAADKHTKTPLLEAAQNCAAALGDELYLEPLRNMGADGAVYEITLGKLASEKVDPFFKAINTVGVFRYCRLPTSVRKSLTGFEFYSALYACFKTIYIHTPAFQTAAKGFDMPTDIEAGLTFDVKWYLLHNDDLSAVFKNNAEYAAAHFHMFGIYEYRDASPVFDPLYYAQKNKLSDCSFAVYRHIAKNANPANTTARLDMTAYKAAHPELKDVLANEMDWLYSYLYRIRPVSTAPRVAFSCHVAGSWSKEVENGAFGETKLQSKWLYGIKMRVTGADKLSVQYNAHFAYVGWSSDWFGAGKETGDAKNDMQCLMARLTGPLCVNYEIIYRTYIPGIGWLGWAKGGQPSGSTGMAWGCSAIEAQIVPKEKVDSYITRNTVPYINDHILPKSMRAAMQ